MAVSWQELRWHARELFDAHDLQVLPERKETILRASAAKAYYGAYHHACEWLMVKRNYFADVDQGKSHQQVWSQFSGRGVGHLQRRGKSLHFRRVRADYGLQLLFTITDCEAMMGDSEDLHRFLDEAS